MPYSSSSFLSLVDSSDLNHNNWSNSRARAEATVAIYVSCAFMYKRRILALISLHLNGPYDTGTSQHRRLPLFRIVLRAQVHRRAVVAPPGHARLLVYNAAIRRVGQQRDVTLHRPQHLGVSAQNTKPNELIVVDYAPRRTIAQLLVKNLRVQMRSVLRRGGGGLEMSDN